MKKGAKSKRDRECMPGHVCFQSEVILPGGSAAGLSFGTIGFAMYSGKGKLIFRERVRDSFIKCHILALIISI